MAKDLSVEAGELERLLRRAVFVIAGSSPSC